MTSLERRPSVLNSIIIDDGSLSSNETAAEASVSHVSSGTDRISKAKAFIDDHESIAVARWRTVVVLMLVLTASLVVTSTYIFLSRSKQEEFKKSFEFSSRTITDAAEFTARNNIQTLQSLADSLTREALTVNATWPFFTSQHFEVLASHGREASFSEVIFFMPSVPGKLREEWEAYSAENCWWIEQSRNDFAEDEHHDERRLQDCSIPARIFNKAEDNPGGKPGDVTAVDDIQRMHYTPIWQVSPPPDNPHKLINYNFMGDKVSARLFNAVELSGGKVIISEFLQQSTLDFLYAGIKSATTDQSTNLTTLQTFGTVAVNDVHDMSFPHSASMAPVYGSFEANDDAFAGYVLGIASWDLYLANLLPKGANGIYAVLSNNCAQTVTYVIMGPEAEFLGNGDLHDPSFDDMKKEHNFTGFGSSNEASRKMGQCDYTLTLYPSDMYKQDFNNNKAIFFSAILVLVFITTGAFFFIFVVYVQRRQSRTMAAALRTNAIVASLFPANVRDRILRDAEEQARTETTSTFKTGAKNLKSFLTENQTQENVDGEDQEELFGSKPIADLFPEVTIMFADMVGFTAWSSVREPSQVFTLLETVYHAFDQIAKRRRVFKVETVGDCYVAVCGLPDKRKDHAIVMCRFAHECYLKLLTLVRDLEKRLGPDTGDLTMRFGLHSGPVTAGVLRGERARFQLFGDTMNTASRMESTGLKDKIHLSSETAKLLEKAGKGHWVVRREDKVVAKGKGQLDTFWLEVGKNRHAYSVQEGSSTTDTKEEQPSLDDDIRDLQAQQMDDKTIRLVGWNTELLVRLLQQIVARRMVQNGPPKGREDYHGETTERVGVIEEVKEIIVLPEFDAKAARREIDANKIVLGDDVVHEIRDYVTTIALLYRDNPFHNFEHVSHVAMSVSKLLSRIIAPTDEIDKELEAIEGNRASRASYQVASSLHDHTYGITSDPLTQFACVFSALIHDVDHTGVPNAQLIKENAKIAVLYGGKSVAEQNSVDIAWDLLMDSRYENFRRTIYASECEFRRFRQLVVNSVMATDIMDKDLKALRNARWDRAFSETSSDSDRDNINRKATIVIEHLIQASDIAHTMQHWHVYRKWNERLFLEMYKAYKDGRGDKDPAEFWYAGEIGFFDFYIIPLAKKLKECGVFGVSSVEYLNYAEKNRAEWFAKGNEVVEQMVQKRDHLLGIEQTRLQV